MTAMPAVAPGDARLLWLSVKVDVGPAPSGSTSRQAHKGEIGAAKFYLKSHQPHIYGDHTAAPIARPNAAAPTNTPAAMPTFLPTLASRLRRCLSCLRRAFCFALEGGSALRVSQCSMALWLRVSMLGTSVVIGLEETGSPRFGSGVPPSSPTSALTLSSVAGTPSCESGSLAAGSSPESCARALTGNAPGRRQR